MSTRLAAVLLVLCLIFPWIPGVPDYWVMLANTIGIAAITALGLVVLTGYGAITSFGQATFVGCGAYTTALLTTHAGVSPWLALPAALIVSAAAAAAIGVVTLRLSGHYLALASIAWAVSLYYVVGNLDFFGRNDGIQGIPPLGFAGLALTGNRAYSPVVWTALVLCLLSARNLLDSRVGRAIRSLRGGAASAASCGVHIARTRMLVFVYAGVLSGLAGWLYAHMQRSVNPTPFDVNASIDYLLMAVVGGLGHLGGAVLGAALVVLANDRLQDVLPRLIGASGNYQTIVFGVILVLVLQAAPEGLWPRLLRRLPRGTRRVAEAPPLPARMLPAAGTPLLEAVSLRKSFGGLVAVNDLALSLHAGEIVGLIGPNGAGKSTTFDLLTGVAHPTAGHVAFLGKSLDRCSAPDVARRGIARSFQHVKLVSGMSVIENVAMGAWLRGHAGAWRAMLRLDRAEEARIFAEAARQLDRVGLRDAADKPAGSLALGQQRVAEIARALALDPVLLLLDEPAAGLRHAEKQALAALLRRLRADGMTILLVEHDMDFVMNLTDRLVVMDFGTKLAEGAAPEIRANPAVIEAYLGSVA